jgi:hypothetical protein
LRWLLAYEKLQVLQRAVKALLFAKPGQLALALLVLGILADDTHHATAVDHLALVTNLLYGGTNLHKTPKTAVYLNRQQDSPTAGAYALGGLLIAS